MAASTMEAMENRVSLGELAERINRLAEGIAQYIQSVLSLHGRLPARSFYGESFSALLLGYSGTQYAAAYAQLCNLYRVKDKTTPNFHWEFNKYAWCTLYRKTGDEEARAFALPLRFRGTPVTNWALLRSCTRYLAEIESKKAYHEAVSVLKHFQLRSGLICDERNVRSFQYHCFSAALVAEIYQFSGKTFFRDSFRRAADFIEKFVLRTGDSLYIGRGQQQLFGYGALCCLLATAYHNFREARYIAALERCLVFLQAYQRSDGSFPLVVNGNEVGYPRSAAASDNRFPGWYAYNNYFDYLPFAGVFFRKAAEAIGGASASETCAALHEADYRDHNFLIIRNKRYEAVLSRPGGGWKGGDGYWTNDLPFPYVTLSGNRITPSYGGEQFGSSLYSPAGVPLPAIVRKGQRRLFRDGRVWSFFLGNCLIVISMKGVLIRRFRFLQDQIIVDDIQLGLGNIFARYLFDQVRELDAQTYLIRGGAVVKFSVPMQFEESREHYWGGPLQAIVAKVSSRRCTVQLMLGDHHESF